MYDKDGKRIKDRREMLRVKIKSLVAEAKIIRQEERRTHGALRNELAEHRRGVVREAARASHLAYGLIRGRTIEQMERRSRTPVPATEIRRLCGKYGPAGFTPGV